MDDRTFGERISDEVAHFGGSWKFILLVGIFFAIWVAFNTLTYFEVWHFDAFPYILLNLVLSFIAAFQAPFIMMSQNRTEKKQDEAYRFFFNEIKELIQQDMESELRIEALEIEIIKELEIVKSQQSKLLERLQQAIAMEKVTHHELGEILQHYDKSTSAE